MAEFSESAVVNFIDGNNKFTVITKGIINGKPDFSKVTLTESIVRALADHGLTKEDLPNLEITAESNSAFKAFTYDLSNIRPGEAKTPSMAESQQIMSEQQYNPAKDSDSEDVTEILETTPDIEIDLINVSKQGKNGVRHLTFAAGTAGTKLFEEIKNNHLTDTDVLLTPKGTIVSIPRVIYYLKDSVLKTVLDENNYVGNQSVQIIEKPSSNKEQEQQIIKLKNSTESLERELNRKITETTSLKEALSAKATQDAKLSGEIDDYYKEKYNNLRNEVNSLKNALEDALLWKDKFEEVKISQQVNEHLLNQAEQKIEILTSQKDEFAQKYEKGQRQVRSVFDAMHVASEFLNKQVVGENSEVIGVNAGGRIE